MVEPDARNRLEALLRLFQEHSLDELLIEEGEMKVHLRSRRADAPAPPGPAPVTPPPAPARPSVPQPERRQRTVAIRSPLIGVFYRSSALDAPAFVDIGDYVEEGQTVCIVEAMKVFNEIKAEWRGRVVAIPAQSGKLVQAGEPLVVLAFEAAGGVDGRRPVGEG